MWSNVSPHTKNVYSEILVRALLLLLLLVINVKLEPNNPYITKAEIHPIYKQTRRGSRVTFETIAAIIIVIPLLTMLSQMLIKNYGRTLQGLLGWTLALVINGVTTEALKVTVRRPRPDFFYRCFPDGVVTADYHCTGRNDIVTEGRKSFPSGHSSFSFCSLGFLALWLKWKVMTCKYSFWTAHLTNLILFIMASIISATRICDNRHHWGDVLAGGAIGLAIAYLSYTRYTDPPKQQASSSEPDSSSSDNRLLLGMCFGNTCSCNDDDDNDSTTSITERE